MLKNKPHHERFDGSGYPRGLSGDNIPAMGRMMGLSDTYAAMTLTRPGAPANSAFKVLRQLKAQGGVLFDKKLVEVFIRAMGVFPTGSLVELNTGEVAIVVEQNNQRRLRPRVMLVLDSAKQPMEQNPLVNLDTKPSDPSDPEALWILNGMEPGSHGVDPRDYYFSEVSRNHGTNMGEPALQG
ncbi:MAG: HD-GYP domain-containing protein [Steroidobacteraceae bacterium]